jgi:excisionase family DNA binding protein
MDLLTEKQTAAYLNCSPYTLQKTRRTGGPNSIPYVRIGRAIRYKVSDLDKYIQSRTYTSTSEYQADEDLQF